MILFIVSFVAGVLTVLAPCVLPLLPVVLAGSVAETKNVRRPIVIIASLSVSVFIFTLLLKGSTALIGASPSFWNYVSAVILIAFGLTLLFPVAWAKIVMKIPGHNKPDSIVMKGYDGHSSFWTDVLVGASLGPVFTTCSPTFFVILATVLPQSFALGIIDLLAYIIGLALSLLLIAWIGQKLIDRLGWALNPNGWFRKTLGVIFIALAILILFGYDKKIESKILASGFFDVTTVEQNIHQALEGKQNLPSYGTDSDSAYNDANGISTSTADAQSSNTQLSNGLPPPPKETNEGKYIEIQKPAGFVNSDPFKLADFVGKKVILIDFVDYTCINCQRTFPYLNDWWSKYKDQGLEIVAIHTPEFSFEKDINNVKMGAAQFGLKFPIVLDNDYATWNAYQNEYWPHKYLIDIHGNVVYDHIGEGGYDETESEIVKLLGDRMKFLGQSGAVTVGTSTVPDVAIQAESPETYFGAARNEGFGNGKSFTAGEGKLTIPNSLTPNDFYLGGTWKIEPEYAESEAASDQISYIFTSGKMYFVAATADGSAVTAQVLIDGKPIPDQWAGADVKNGIMTISQSRLYSLYSNAVLGRHRIDLIFNKPGVRAYTFTFG